MKQKSSKLDSQVIQERCQTESHQSQMLQSRPPEQPSQLINMGLDDLLESESSNTEFSASSVSMSSLSKSAIQASKIKPEPNQFLQINQRSISGVEPKQSLGRSSDHKSFSYNTKSRNFDDFFSSGDEGIIPQALPEENEVPNFLHTPLVRTAQP
jgi:hypothetical protein